MNGSKTITQMSVRERQDLLATVAEALELTAGEALLQGNGGLAVNSRSLALTIRGSADELASADLRAAEILLQQAIILIELFRLRQPSRPETLVLH